MGKRSENLASLSDNLFRVAVAVERLVPTPLEARLTNATAGRAISEADTFGPAVKDPTARVAVLAVAIRLKNRADASEPITGADLKSLEADYANVQELFDLLGGVGRDETLLAEALDLRLT